MHKLILGMAVLCSFTALADNLNVYTKVGGNFYSSHSKLDVDNDENVENFFPQVKGGAKFENEKVLLKGYSFNVEATKNLNKYVEFGVGTGIIFNKHLSYSYEGQNDSNQAIGIVKVKTVANNQIPVYLTTKLNFSNSDVKPYIKADLGYAFNAKLKNFEYDEKIILPEDQVIDEVKSKNGGLYAGIAAGIEYKNVIVELNAKYAGYAIELKHVGQQKSYTFKGNKTVGLSLGYKFSL